MTRMEWSHYQDAIFTHVEGGTTPGAVNAVAGSGKTTVLVESALRGTMPALFIAFNRHIVEHLRSRLSHPAVTISTIHSLGYGALRHECNGRLVVRDDKYLRLALTFLDKDPALWKGYDRSWDAALACQRLADLVRLTLRDPSDTAGLQEAIQAYDIVATPALVEWLPRLLKRGAKAAEDDGDLDYTDMLWLASRWGLAFDRYPAVYVDEVQDLNPAQLAIALACRQDGARGLLVGDPKQSIFGWAHADVRSFEKASAAVGATELPLSICYRCPTSHLDLARVLVPHIEPRPDAPVGDVRRVGYADFLREVADGDMVLCRFTAPLIEACLALLRARRRAFVKGRDIGRELGATVRQVKPYAVGGILEFEKGTFEWAKERHAKLTAMHAPRATHAALDDRVDGVLAAYAGLAPVESWDDLERRVVEAFSDRDQGGVMLSTVHRAKGLESDKVWVLKPEKLTTETQEEANVKYVCLTRSRHTLCFVEGGSGL